MFELTSSGDTSGIEAFLRTGPSGNFRRILERHASEGVAALAAATDRDTGLTASDWGYRISQNGSSYTLSFTNSNIDADGVPVVLLLQYGHGTGSGGYVVGRDFINPAIRPVFDKIVDELMREVSG